MVLELFFHLQQGGLGGAEFQFVCLGHEDMDGHVGLGRPFQHQQVEILEWVADVHHQHQAHQRLAFRQVMVQVLLPFIACAFGHFGVAIAGQIHQAAFLVQLEEVQ